MSKKTKQILSFLVSVVMIFSMFAGINLSAFAESDILDYLEYEIIDGEVTITDCDESISGDVIIPDTIEGYPVTVIGEEAFMNVLLREITIPASVREFTFYNSFDFLKKFIVSDDNQYFSSDEHGVLFNKEKTILYHYPPCNPAISYDIPEGVIQVCGLAFQDATNLQNVTIPDTVKTIGGEAFFSCTGLKSIVVPSSVTEQYYSSFQNCISLEKAEIYSSVICDAMFLGCISLKDVYISENVKEIEHYAFHICSGLEEITIPKSVEYVDRHAFWYCESLNDIYICNPDIELYELPADELDFDMDSQIGFAGRRITDREKYFSVLGEISDEYKRINEIKCSVDDLNEYESYLNECSAQFNSITADLESCFEYIEEPIKTENLVFHGYENSSTAEYAEKYGFKFVPICDHLNTEVINTATADCNNDGYTGDIYCNDCEEIIEYGEVVTATGHTDADNNSICDVCETVLETVQPEPEEPVEPEVPAEPEDTEESQSFFDKLIEFFKKIIEFIKNLFA